MMDDLGVLGGAAVDGGTFAAEELLEVGEDVVAVECVEQLGGGPSQASRWPP
jgi:hypothetical protein